MEKIMLVYAAERDSVTRFSINFLLSRFYLGPILTGNNNFSNLLVSKDIRSQSSQIACPTTRTQNFSLCKVFFTFLNYCYWVSLCKHTHENFSPDCSFKICEKPLKLAVRVRVTNDYADIVFRVVKEKHSNRRVSRFSKSKKCSYSTYSYSVTCKNII